MIPEDQSLDVTIRQNNDLHHDPSLPDMTRNKLCTHDHNVNELVPGTVYEHKRQDTEGSQLGKALSLAIAYAATIGGTGSMTGAAPNFILKDQLDK